MDFEEMSYANVLHGNLSVAECPVSTKKDGRDRRARLLGQEYALTYLVMRSSVSFAAKLLKADSSWSPVEALA